MRRGGLMGAALAALFCAGLVSLRGRAGVAVGTTRQPGSQTAVLPNTKRTRSRQRRVSGASAPPCTITTLDEPRGASK